MRQGVDGSQCQRDELKSSRNVEFSEVCESEKMLKREMVRGQGEKIFYCEVEGSQHSISEICNGSSRRVINKREIYQVPGARIVAFEADTENVAADKLIGNKM